MTITITIHTDNTAFGEDNEDRDLEVARIIRWWAGRIPEDGYTATLFDINGNSVGRVEVTR